MVNKKGQQMTLGTIIAIVLGIAVLVLLIFGFATGWNTLWDRVTTFGGGDVNVDTIVQACALQCSTGNKYGFCTQERTVNYGVAITAWNGTAVEEGVTSSPGTCKNMTNTVNYPNVNVAGCPSLC